MLEMLIMFLQIIHNHLNINQVFQEAADGVLKNVKIVVQTKIFK